MAPQTKVEQDLTALKSTVETISTLIAQLQRSKALESEPTDKTRQINALALAHDSASLIKAHSTKLSLLIINKPFTATAISTVLRELVSGPLPGLSSAVELCTAASYTKVMSAEVQWRAKKVFMELATLVEVIPIDGKVLSEDQKNGTGKEKGKGSLASTGVVWKACEDVMALKGLGIGGLVVRRVNEYKALLQDALKELQEWGDEESDEDDVDDEVGSGDDENKFSAQDAVDDIFGSQQHIPTDDPEKIRPKLESTKRKLRLVILMYQAAVKRRFKTIPLVPQPELPTKSTDKSINVSSLVSLLDEALDILKTVPDSTDELASAFYELNSDEIDKRMEECFSKGLVVTELLSTNWLGETDEFSAWARKFQTAMKKE